ncbi:MAG: type II toxin-antitoxin system mRNA interferase toxin, RelE/StbE family [Bacteroidetes bacterium]|nr:type II toxin-antitoxin system mRNA interferase toxin, RelE/StbE family [Bacteroidota bacterium]
MIVEFDKSFEKSLDKLKDKSLFPKIEKLILKLESKESLIAIPQIKKLEGFKNYYRYRIGDYRIGIEKINETKIRLIVVAHRKEIYKSFP